MHLSMLIVLIINCIVLLVLVGLVSRFYARFQQYRRELDTHLLGLIAMLKKQQTTATELLIEQRRSIRLQLEGLDLKRAEMTGDFDVVEEPIPTPVDVEQKQPQFGPPPASSTPIHLPDPEADFPELELVPDRK